jgi:hypothetical protein
MSTSNLTTSRIFPGGIKIVDNNLNKRVSDIFNLKSEVTYENSQINRENRRKIMELTEKMIDEKLRQKTPFREGVPNSEYIPQNLNSSIDNIDKKYLPRNYLNKRQSSSSNFSSMKISDLSKITNFNNTRQNLNRSLEEVVKDNSPAVIIINQEKAPIKSEQKLKKSSSAVFLPKQELSFHV